jgi:hypothetical protein
MENAIFISTLERIIAAPSDDVIEIAMSVEEGTRARLAVFLFSRAHLRNKGLVVATVCRLSELTAESSTHVAANLMVHSEQKGSARQRQRQAISLAST